MCYDVPMIREITIKPVLNGFVCKVGCQTVVFGDTATLASQIKAYYDDPERTEATYLKSAVNKTNDGPCAQDCAPAPISTGVERRVLNTASDCCEQTSPSRR